MQLPYLLHFSHAPARLAISIRGSRHELTSLIPPGHVLRPGRKFEYNGDTKTIFYNTDIQKYPGLDFYLLALLHEIGHAHLLGRWRWWIFLQKMGIQYTLPAVLWERGAWVWALRTYRKLVRNGLPVVASHRDILTFVNRHNLCSYEIETFQKTGRRAGFWHGPLQMRKIRRVQAFRGMTV